MKMHTPGPWEKRQEAVDPDWWIVMTTGGSIVANVNNADTANASLVAAAPDLLKAAKAMRDDPVIKTVCSSPLWAVLVNSIARAEGRE